MEKIKVSICTGTACFVMGASEILLLEEELPEELRGMVQVEGVTCFEGCKNPECGQSPFVKINDEVIDKANLVSVIERISEIAGIAR